MHSFVKITHRKLIKNRTCHPLPVRLLKGTYSYLKPEMDFPVYNQPAATCRQTTTALRTIVDSKASLTLSLSWFPVVAVIPEQQTNSWSPFTKDPESENLPLSHRDMLGD
jgi:hypothetical protein